MEVRQIEYSQTFVNQMHRHLDYLNRQLGTLAATQMLETFLNDFESRIFSHPRSAPLCEETSSLGMTGYRDYINSGLSLRVVYRFDKTDSTIYVLLFLHTRQSIRQALIDYCLRC